MATSLGASPVFLGSAHHPDFFLFELSVRAIAAAFEALRAISNRRAAVSFLARISPPVRPASAKNCFCSFVNVKTAVFT